MAACDFCGTTILFGGVTEGSLRYCNQRCHQGGMLMRSCSEVASELVDGLLLDVHGGECPRCKGPGPVDVHTGYRAYSMIVMTTWSSPQQICCRSCGVKHQLGSALITATCGWWGFPWGLIATPVQIARNIAAMVRPPDPNLPSPKLERLLRLQIGAAAMQHTNATAQAAPPTQPQQVNAQQGA